ncbi:hypothetical protein [Salinarimonas rosea]|uniref:hypothetical protein n=1 Tax=Salinarimonas rosea TaxID=552063 RepID=UPI00048C6C50|nr:hypothetical protein [Salinarimonas rosea]
MKTAADEHTCVNDDEILDIANEVFGASAEQSVGRALGRHHRFGHSPRMVEDPNDPPSWAHQGMERLDYEEALGRYDPDTGTITKWPRGIARAAEVLDVKPHSLDRLVDLHEHAHSLHHRGVASTSARPQEIADLLSRQDKVFRAIRKDAGEQVAQLATLLVLRQSRDLARHRRAVATFDDFLDAFFCLMRRQSDPYRLPPGTRTMDLSRLQDKLILLVEMTDAGMSPSADNIRRILD